MDNYISEHEGIKLLQNFFATVWLKTVSPRLTCQQHFHLAAVVNWLCDILLKGSEEEEKKPCWIVCILHDDVMRNKAICADLGIIISTQMSID